MFFRAYKHKKIADAVLDQVHPLLAVVKRFGGVTPASLASDKYVLGFLCANIGIEMQRAGGASLDQAGRGTVMLLVFQQLFGRGTVNEKEIGDLMLGLPAPNPEFKGGIEAAAKIQAVASGRHNLQTDPAYLAAKQVVSRGGSSFNVITPGATEDEKIAGQMLHALFYQHVMNRHQTTQS